MDLSNKDETAGENSNTLEDWRMSGSNPPVLCPPENQMSICHSSCSPSQMMDSFRQNLWHDNGFNVHTDAGTSNVMTSLDRPLETGWSMSQFPADSGFIERAAKFSLLGCGGSFSEMMMNQHGVQESVGFASGSNVVKDRSNGLSNVSEGSQSSGHVKCGETISSKGFNSKKRKRVGPDQQSGEEQVDKKQRDEESPNSNGKKNNEVPKDEFIHMRARRGQATNSHSLAERVRREKISERMKFLQDLVPGCDKVTGKAVMLDEIINYVQSLQRQIEFLSMKLSTVNPMLDFNLESLLRKDALQLAAPTYPQNMPMFYPPLSYLSQTGIMQPNVSSMPPLNGGLKRQETQGYEGDLHMNHETGTAPDHEHTAGESKSQILSYMR